MRTKQLLFTTLLLVFFVNFSNALVKDINSVSLNNVEVTLEDTVPDTFSPVQGSEAVGLDEFPNLHPLVVHFPIALLLLAVLLQFIQLFTMNRTMDWVILLTVGAGFIGAYVAGTFVHPNTEGLTETAKEVLEQHDKYATWTIWSSAIAAVLKLGSLFLFKQKRWFEISVFLVLAFAGYSVGWAGHYGSQLVYIEGVGPQGQFLGDENGENHGEGGEHSH